MNFKVNAALGTLACFIVFVVISSKMLVGSETGAMPKMEHGLVARIVDRMMANARVVKGAPEAFAFLGIMTLGLSYLVLQEFHRERLAVLDDRIASQEALLGEYRTKLEGATPEQAARQIEQLTKQLGDTQKALNDVKTRVTSLEKLPRDPRRLYQDNTTMAFVQDPKVDLDKKTVMFPAVTSQVLLGNDKIYEFQTWKLACGGTRLYNTVSTGATHEFNYSPLICKIVGSR
jgi:hypothetical protein